VLGTRRQKKARTGPGSILGLVRRLGTSTWGDAGRAQLTLPPEELIKLIVMATLNFKPARGHRSKAWVAMVVGCTSNMERGSLRTVSPRSVVRSEDRGGVRRESRLGLRDVSGGTVITTWVGKIFEQARGRRPCDVSSSCDAAWVPTRSREWRRPGCELYDFAASSRITKRHGYVAKAAFTDDAAAVPPSAKLRRGNTVLGTNDTLDPSARLGTRCWPGILTCRNRSVADDAT